jgi:hypothetical protein
VTRHQAALLRRLLLVSDVAVTAAAFFAAIS